MTNSLQIGKKALTVVVAAATILWTVGLTSFVAPQASAASYGNLIKGTTLSTVYYYGSDGQRYSFPNEKTYFSWYKDFSSVVTISDAELANITLAGNIAYRPGSRWIKIVSDAKVYAVSRDGAVHWIENEATATGLAGSAWNTHIDDVPDVFFVDYTVGDSLTSPAGGYDGMVWSDGTNSFLVWNGKVSPISAAGLSANGYQSGSVLMGTGFTKAGLTAGAAITGPLANLMDAAQMVTTDTYVVGANVSVSLASDSPASSTLIETQALADLGHFMLTNNSATPATFTGLTVTRTGVSADATLSNTYLFNGNVRLTDAATISSGKISFNDASGIAVIPAGGSLTVSVRSDIANATSGQTLGVKIAASGDVKFSGGSMASGSFPLVSAIHTIATDPATFATANFADGDTANPAAAAVDPQDGYRVWQQNLTVAQNDVNLKAISFRNIGSINDADVTNWKFFVAGIQYGGTVAKEDADGYVTFDLSASPLNIKTGTHTMKVLADIVGGSGRTVTVGLRSAGDIVLVDGDYAQGVLPSVDGNSFAAMDAGAQSVNNGSLTISKATNSPSGDVTVESSGVTLGRWEVKAYGEQIKLESLPFFVNVNADAGAPANADVTLRNAMVYANGVQVGSTASLEASAAGATFTTFNFGSSLVVTPGSPVTLELKADIYDNEGAQELAANDTLQVAINLPASNNAQRISSGGFFIAPAADKTANTMTVKAGDVTVAKNTSYAAQSVVAPKTAYKVGSWTIKASTTEALNLNEIAVEFDADNDADAALATADYTNLYIQYGPVGNMVTSNIKGTVGVSNTWSLNYGVAKGATIYVNAFADVASDVTDGGAADTIMADLAISGTAVDSSTPVSGDEVDAQVITYLAAGTFTTALDGSSLVARSIAGNQEVEAAKYRFTAQNESYTINEMTLKVINADDASAIASVNIYDGSTLVGSGVLDQSSNTAALITGLSVPVNAGSYKILTAKLVLNQIGTGAGYTSRDVALTLDSVKRVDSQGVADTDATDRAGNELRVYKSVPTISAVDLTNSTIVNGQARDLFKFTVTATSAGSVALKQLQLPVNLVDTGTDDSATIEVESLKLYKNGSDVSTGSSDIFLLDESANDVEDATGLVDASTALYIVWDTSEETIAAGETVTYTIRGTMTGFDVSGDSGENDTFSIYLAGDSAHKDGGTNANTGVAGVCLADTGDGEIWQLDDTASLGTACTAADVNEADASFIWSDMSGSGHDGTETSSSDWAAGYKLLNLDLDSETWSK